MNIVEDKTQTVLQLVADNYNSHKNEKNQTLELDHIKILQFIVEGDQRHYFITTKRNDGLLYEVIMNDKTEKTILYLYNRIARRVITKEQDA